MKIKSHAQHHIVLDHCSSPLAPGESKEISESLAAHPHIKHLLASGKLVDLEPKQEVRPEPVLESKPKGKKK